METTLREKDGRDVESDLDLYDATTPDPGELVVGRHLTEPSAIGLTIAWHPDLSRVGDRLLITGEPINVGRLGPSFTSEDGRPTGPLADRHVSRTPMLFAERGGAVEFSGRADVDGVPIDGSMRIPATAIRRGVTIAINHRVLLLLSRVPSTSDDEDDLGLSGDSLAIRRLRIDIREAAGSDAPLLVRGETGAGKELVARAVHRVSPRAGGPYQAVNVAAIPSQVATSALFGHVRGAFSGAEQSEPGYLRVCDGGTLFLDEIGELRPALQPLLLRTLESGEIQPVGDRRSRPVDVRIIAATDAPLGELCEQGRFSRSLFFRLTGVELTVPPLRDRREDVPRLLLMGLRRELERVGVYGRAVAHLGSQSWLDVGTVTRLNHHRWPGNVRELMNVARQIVLAGWRRGRVPVERVAAIARIPAVTESSAAREAQEPTSGRRTRLTEHRVLEALEQAQWSVGRAAGRMGVARTTLYRFLERTRLLRAASEIPDVEVEAVWRAYGGDAEAMSARLRISPRSVTMRANTLGLVLR